MRSHRTKEDAARASVARLLVLQQVLVQLERGETDRHLGDDACRHGSQTLQPPISCEKKSRNGLLLEGELTLYKASGDSFLTMNMPVAMKPRGFVYERANKSARMITQANSRGV